MTSWVDMDRSAKEEAVRPLLLDGLSYSAIAQRLGATSRNAIGTIATSLRQKGTIALRPRKSMPEPRAAREKRAPKPAKAPAPKKAAAPKRDKVLKKSASGSMDVVPMRGPNNPHYNDFKARAAQRAASPGLPDHLIAGEPAKPLGVVPLSRRLKLVDLTSLTCRWPNGDPLAEDFGFCGHDASGDGPYCSFHSKIAYQPVGARHAQRS